MKKMTKVLILILMVFLTSGCCFSVGSVVIGKDCNKKMSCKTEDIAIENAFDLPTSYSNAYQKAVKSIVTIIAQTSSNKGSSSSSGSGIVFAEDNSFVYVVTNKHVVASKTSNYLNAHKEIEIVFHDFTRVKGTFVASANNIDISVVKISKNSVEGVYVLPTVKNSFKDIFIGDTIFALGSPLGLEHAFSTSYGVVSNLYNTEVDFTGENLGSYYPIQIDAAVNPGNSGGGLFNASGDLIGMVQGGRTTGTENSNTVVTTGVNYAIPITTVLNVANNLKNNGNYSVADFGINEEFIMELATMSQSDRLALGVSDNEKTGLLVRHVNLNGPAKEAGLNLNFVIESLDGISINTLGKFLMYLNSKNEGEVISVKGHYINTETEVTYNITLD